MLQYAALMSIAHNNYCYINNLYKQLVDVHLSFDYTCIFKCRVHKEKIMLSIKKWKSEKNITEAIMTDKNRARDLRICWLINIQKNQKCFYLK